MSLCVFLEVLLFLRTLTHTRAEAFASVFFMHNHLMKKCCLAPILQMRTQVRKSEGTWQAVASPGGKPRSVCFQSPPFLFHPGVHVAADAPSTVLTSHLDASYLCRGLSNLRCDTSLGAEDQMTSFRAKCQVPWASRMAFPNGLAGKERIACWPGDVTGCNRGQLS